MLIQKKMEAGDIISILLSNGQELIAKLVSENPGSITITKPLVVNIGSDGSGNVGIQMIPYFVITSEPEAKLEIKDVHIITKTVSNEQAKNGYIRNTIGLSVPSNVPSGLVK